MEEKQHEFTLDELVKFLEGRKDINNLSLHSSGSGTVKVNHISDVLITSSREETLDQLKSGRLSVGTYSIGKGGCLIRHRKKWASLEA